MTTSALTQVLDIAKNRRKDRIPDKGRLDHQNLADVLGLKLSHASIPGWRAKP